MININILIVKYFFFYSMKTKKGIFEEGTLWNDRKNSFDVICASGRGMDVSSRK